MKAGGERRPSVRAASARKAAGESKASNARRPASSARRMPHAKAGAMRRAASGAAASRFAAASEGRADSRGFWVRAVAVVAAVAALCIAAAVLFAPKPYDIPRGERLPAYIDENMLQAVLRMQDEYGHPAGCTIAQIIQESGAGDTPSALASVDSNYFGMKWHDSFAGAQGVEGPAPWDTSEEYDGRIVGISGTFVKFSDAVACIEFRSRVFLQGKTYRESALIQEAIATGSSATMAYGLQEAGWATDSGYAASLIALMDEYDLYRFDA